MGMMPNNELIAEVRTKAMSMEFSQRWLILEMANRLEIATNIEAVPVVRCKDCKYINREIHAKGYGCLCDAHSCDREGHERYLYVEDYDFCSYGERREGE